MYGLKFTALDFTQRSFKIKNLCDINGFKTITFSLHALLHDAFSVAVILFKFYLL